jgi:nucleoside-diphosphate-sugar epimerase
LAGREGASVHNLDGPVATVQEVIEEVERAAPEAAGLITAGEEPLPFPSTLDSTSFVDLVGRPTSRPLAEGAAETIARFRG